MAEKQTKSGRGYKTRAELLKRVEELEWALQDIIEIEPDYGDEVCGIQDIATEALEGNYGR